MESYSSVFEELHEHRFLKELVHIILRYTSIQSYKMLLEDFIIYYVLIYQLRLPGDSKFFTFKCSVNVTIKKN